MKHMPQTLVEKLNAFSELRGLDELKRNIPNFITNNLNPKFEIREYQKEALARFQYYFSEYNDKKYPIHLLFHMATGSGKTLLMASDILYLYQQGYRNFIFFVNSTTIIQKTKANFLDKSSAKYLFADKIGFKDREIQIEEVQKFEVVNPDNINILFTTIQELHSHLNAPQENAVSYEDFEQIKTVFLSDEAHHINTLTKNWAKMTKEEQGESTSWENTINKIFQSNNQNIMLEYTATVDLAHRAIREKYEDKIIFQYTLKEFREHKFSKDVQIIQSDLDIMSRSLQAVILNQYKRKVAEKNRITLKPVMLMKAQRTIAQSKDAETKFKNMIKSLTKDDLLKIELSSQNGVIRDAFDFFDKNKITKENLIKEIQEDFSEEKCIAINSKEESEEKQLRINTLEDEHNEIRVIFTVNMLNEGWDVLNLFDIVRLYETRDTKYGKPGSTTISEAQLIGRGARYYPFVVKKGEDKFRRKYDEDLSNELRVLEQLHYHSLNDSRYISEIKSELVKTGIAAPDDRRKEVTISLKRKVKKSRFWKKGLIFLNEPKRNDNANVKNLKDIVSELHFKYRLSTGRTIETNVFDTERELIEPDFSADLSKTVIKFNHIGRHINRKALDKIDFYKFCNLKGFFPSLTSINEFITSSNYLGQVDIEIYGLKNQLDNLTNRDMYDIALRVFKDLSKRIENNSTEFTGTKEFKRYSISEIAVETKRSEILIGGIDKEYGTAMGQTKNEDLRLNLDDHDWYIYDENYGTAEEKYFVQFIKYTINELIKKYTDVYLLPNEKPFKIYRFSDGKAMEPDFVLFLTEKKSKRPFSFQLFVEAKGQHLVRTDQWKEEFLNKIEDKFEIVDMFDGDKYKVVGLPFFNESLKKKDFQDKFRKILRI
jgi:type III restriction enzyme